MSGSPLTTNERQHTGRKHASTHLLNAFKIESESFPLTSLKVLVGMAPLWFALAFGWRRRWLDLYGCFFPAQA